MTLLPRKQFNVSYTSKKIHKHQALLKSLFNISITYFNKHKTKKHVYHKNDHLTSLKFPLVPGISVGNSSGVLLPQDL